MSGHIQRVMDILNSNIIALRPSLALPGVDSTRLEAYGYKDGAWGYDHVHHRHYWYKVHLLCDLTMAPICYMVTPANWHDNTQIIPLYLLILSATPYEKILFWRDYL